MLTAGAYDIERAVSKLVDKKTGWELKEQFATENGKIYRLNNDYWLMFFLHWRPLDQEKQNLNLDYVRKLLFNFWGPNMPFELTGQEGEMEIAGHKAFYIDASIYKGAVKTRFIVWNCPETGRQMIADTNINQSVGTPAELLKLQEDIAKTVSCHKQEPGDKNPILSEKYKSDTYNLSFYIPSSWRTSDYSDSAWFPKGLTDTNGSLWTLPTDSEKFVHIEDFAYDGTLSNEMFKEKFTKSMSGEFNTDKTKLLIEDSTLHDIQKDNNGFSSKCSFTFHFKTEKYDIKMNYMGNAYLLEKNGKGILIIAGMQKLTEFWGKPNDLTPSDKTFSKFIEDDIKPLLQE
jgi:hypothetical protein